MKKYRFIKWHNQYSAGDIAELPPGTGAYLVRMRVAEEVQEEASEGPKLPVITDPKKAASKKRRSI